jgi:hypothetical protein
MGLTLQQLRQGRARRWRAGATGPARRGLASRIWLCQACWACWRCPWPSCQVGHGRGLQQLRQGHAGRWRAGAAGPARRGLACRIWLCQACRPGWRCPWPSCQAVMGVALQQLRQGRARRWRPALVLLALPVGWPCQALTGWCCSWPSCRAVMGVARHQLRQAGARRWRAGVAGPARRGLACRIWPCQACRPCWRCPWPLCQAVMGVTLHQLRQARARQWRPVLVLLALPVAVMGRPFASHPGRLNRGQRHPTAARWGVRQGRPLLRPFPAKPRYEQQGRRGAMGWGKGAGKGPQIMNMNEFFSSYKSVPTLSPLCPHFVPTALHPANPLVYWDLPVCPHCPHAFAAVAGEERNFRL